MKSFPFVAAAVLVLVSFSACGGTDGNQPTGSVCGNGAVEAGEECDAGAENSDAGACTTSCTNAVCGDGLVHQGFEGCDDGNDDDTDACLSTCKLASCGDAVIQEGEECDDGNDVDTDACTINCLAARCGDGIVQGDEACDDGDANSDTGACTTSCTAATCGDGFVQGDEACDDGDANSDTGACTTSCKAATCGDGFVQGDEECDDGAANSDTGACTTRCTAATCGDGFVQGDEECDDGAANADDASCRPGCIANVCNDGFHDRSEGSTEECDLGTDNSDGAESACTRSCTLPTCGDGLVQNDELCDDHNDIATDDCPTNCRPAECGDGFVHEGEEACDLGNGNSDDADATCRTDCTPRRCGDGIRDAGEACDDGNDVDGDGCNTFCRIEGQSCASPAVLGATASAFTTTGNTTDFDPSVDLAFCTAPTASNRDMVYSFTSPIAARWAFEIDPAAGFEAALGVLAHCDTTSPIPADVLGCAARGSRVVTVDLTANQTIFLVVDGFDDGASINRGTFTLSGTPTPIVGAGAGCANAICESHLVCNPTSVTCASNVCGDGFIRDAETCDDGNTTPGDGCSASCEVEGDICASAGALAVRTDGTVHFTGSTTAASSDFDSGCAVNGDTNASKDVVFTFTSPTDARWTFHLASNFDSVLAVHATCGDKASVLACDNNGGNNGGDQISVTLGAGETVYLLVDAFDAATRRDGNFTLTGSSTPVAAAGAACSTTQHCAPGSFCYLIDGICLNTCGNGNLDAGSRESCDDGNTTAGDGCSANCVREAGWSCPSAGAPCRPIVCGDGFVDAPETCDDGNLEPGDGCSDVCQFEAYPLPEPGSNLVVASAFSLDDPTWVSPGLSCTHTSSTLRRYKSFALVNTGTTAKTVDIQTNDLNSSTYLHLYAAHWSPEQPLANCLEAVLASAPLASGVTVQPGETYIVVVTDFSEAMRDFQLRVSNPGSCGDGIWGNAEACDDGNAIAGDGCDACVVEPGFTCSHATATCVGNVCGDGLVGAGEACDDGNAFDFDTCDNTCTLRGESCADAAVIQLAQGDTAFAITGDTRGARPDEDLDCAGFYKTAANPDHVYVFTAPTAGIWTFTARADTNNYNIGLGVQRVCGDPSRNLACEASSPPYVGGYPGSPLKSRTASAEMLAGETAYLVIDGYTETNAFYPGAGAYSLSGTVYPYLPAGDACDPDGVQNRCADGFVCSGGTSPVCVPTVCGNGVIEPGEECEGNGPGCTACKMDAVPLAAAGSSIVFSGSVDAGDPTWLPPNDRCLAVNPQRTGDWHYDVYYVRNTGTTTALVDIDVSAFIISGAVFVYDLPFDPAAPLANCGRGSLTSAPNLQNVEIRAGEARAIVVGTGYESERTPGSYTLRVTTEPVCGDGIWGDAEECDFGDVFDGDGCSSSCEVEPSWTCSRTTGSCFLNVCGDGEVGNGEACDDGNTNETDSCLSTCAWNGADCGSPVVLAPAAADVPLVVAGDNRGMGADYTLGCANTANTADVFYAFTAPLHGIWRFEVRGEVNTAIALMTTCGVSSTEVDCKQAGFVGAPDRVQTELAAGESIFVVVDGQNPTSSMTHEGPYRLSIDVTPIHQLGESCDPGGVTAICGPGMACDPDTLLCTDSICGNGQLESGEECDDGNVVDGDGCSAACLVDALPLAEPGFALRIEGDIEANDDIWGPPNTACTPNVRTGYRYDTYVVRNTGTVAKTVDFGLSRMPLTTFVYVYDLPFDPAQQTANCVQGGSGLNPAVNNLSFEPGQARLIVVSSGSNSSPIVGPYTLTAATRGGCGDGIWGDNEACDGGAGCTATCQPDPGYSCVRGVGCAPNVCGDGVVGDTEECDDGNTLDGDTCSSTCLSTGATCADVGVITTTAASPNFAINGTTVGGGRDYAAIAPCVSGGTGSRDSADRVYEFTAPVGGTWTFAINGHTFDSLLAVTSACGMLYSELGCSELGIGGAPDYVRLDIAAGDTVFIVVDGYSTTSASNEGPFTLTGKVVPFRQLGEACDPHGIDGSCGSGGTCDSDGPMPICVAPSCGNGKVEAGEACDDGNNVAGDGCTADCKIEGASCSMPRVVSAGADNTFTVSGDTTGAPRSYSMGCAATDNSGDLHFQFTAPLAGRWKFAMTPTGFDSALAVTRACGDASQQIACVEAGGSGAVDQVEVVLAANETIFIVADGYSTATASNEGPFVLTGELLKPVRGVGVACDPTGAVDECVDGSTCHLTSGLCVAATCGNTAIEPGETCDDGNSNDWDACSNDCQVRGDSCAAPFDLRAMNTSGSAGQLLVTGDLLGFQHDHVPACLGSMVETGNRRDVVYALSGNGLTDERWTLTLTTPGSTAANGIVLDVASACVPRNARIACEADIRSTQPGTVEFTLDANETIYVWVDERSAHTVAKSYTLTATIETASALGGSCNPFSPFDGCSKGLVCDGTSYQCVSAVCGNSQVEGEEECDDGPGGSATCSPDCYVIGDTCNAPYDLVAMGSLQSGAWQHTGDLSGMTSNYIPHCTSAGGYNDVVYLFTAPIAGTYTFSESTAFDAALYASRTCPDSHGNPDLVCTANEFFQLPMAAGETIFVFLERAGSGTPGVPGTNPGYSFEVFWSP